MTTYTDYRYKFSDLAIGIAGLTALGNAGLFDASDGPPTNALGDLRNSAGGIIASPYDDAGALIAGVWRGGKGTPASSFTDDNTGETVTVSARGDGTSWYVDIRSAIASISGFDPTAYGMTPVDAGESAEVLGVWAS